ncbi:hypothetical protein BDF19DRAFT_421344 [Syncephalis fuscata]|nr:hypothetical protein BDF19DRAFT_421344 [Syncephalis fuscata]
MEEDMEDKMQATGQPEPQEGPATNAEGQRGLRQIYTWDHTNKMAFDVERHLKMVAPAWSL